MPYLVTDVIRSKNPLRTGGKMTRPTIIRLSAAASADHSACRQIYLTEIEASIKPM